MNSEERKDQPSTTPSATSEDLHTIECQKTSTGDLSLEERKEQPLTKPSATSEDPRTIECQKTPPTRYMNSKERKEQPSTTPSAMSEDLHTIECQKTSTGDLNLEERKEQPLTKPSAIMSEGQHSIECQKTPTGYLHSEEGKEQPQTIPFAACESAADITECQEAPSEELNSEESNEQPSTTHSSIYENSNIQGIPTGDLNAISNEGQEHQNCNTTQRQAAPAGDVYPDKRKKDKHVSRGIILHLACSVIQSNTSISVLTLVIPNGRLGYIYFPYFSLIIFIGWKFVMFLQVK